ncbi:MAG: amino acid amidase [Desulfobacteraceae bacterium]|nr:amino acid amidase [Desulfobacteraceae bacterium]
MKVFISADIEGVAGVNDWKECSDEHPDYSYFKKRMTLEVAGSCEGALDAGATEIVVKDAHNSARNIIISELPTPVEVIRGWSGHPYLMMEGIDDSFDAAMMVGYHDKAGSDRNPLAHTISSRSFAAININGTLASEFLINAYTAALHQVPVVFISGDHGICDDAKVFEPMIETAPVKRGVGGSTISIHPQLAVDKIKDAARMSLTGDAVARKPELPEYFDVELEYMDFKDAYRSSFYPGAVLKDTKTISFSTDDYFNVLKLLMFVN